MSDLPEAKINARVKQLQHHMHFDEAMPMALRMEWEDDRRELLAENQRLREALELIAAMPQNTFEPLDAPTVAREALAGDAAPPDPDTSPFDKPRLETVEKGIPGPWNNKTWENDNG